MRQAAVSLISLQRRCPPMLNTTAFLETAESVPNGTPQMVSPSSQISAEVSCNPACFIAERKYARLTDCPNALGICSMNQTSKPSLLNPKTQLSRLHALPPLRALCAMAPLTMTVGRISLSLCPFPADIEDQTALFLTQSQTIVTFKVVS